MYILELLPIFLPTIMGSITALLCNVSKSSGNTVKIRPPPAVFGIAWFILYILIGLSWFYARQVKNGQLLADIFYIILNIALCSWILVYSCANNKKAGVYTLVISIICTIWCYSLGNQVSKILIVPLLGWLFLATLINVLEVS